MGTARALTTESQGRRRLLNAAARRGNAHLGKFLGDRF